MGVSDAELCFFDTAADTGQALVISSGSSDISDNVIELWPHEGGAATQGFNIGNGEPMLLWIQVTTTLTGTNSIVTPSLVSDSTADLATSPTTHLTLAPLTVGAASGTAGYERYYPLAPNETWERFLGIDFACTVANVTAGKVKAQLVRAPQANVFPPNGMNFGTESA